MYFMFPAARATSGNHGNGIYHNISLFLGIFKNVPVVSFDLRCQSGIWMLSSYIMRLEDSYLMYCSLTIVLTVINSERQKTRSNVIVCLE